MTNPTPMTEQERQAWLIRAVELRDALFTSEKAFLDHLYEGDIRGVAGDGNFVAFLGESLKLTKVGNYLEYKRAKETIKDSDIEKIGPKAAGVAARIEDPELRNLAVQRMKLSAENSGQLTKQNARNIKSQFQPEPSRLARTATKTERLEAELKEKKKTILELKDRVELLLAIVKDVAPDRVPAWASPDVSDAAAE